MDQANNAPAADPVPRWEPEGARQFSREDYMAALSKLMDKPEGVIPLEVAHAFGINPRRLLEEPPPGSPKICSILGPEDFVAPLPGKVEIFNKALGQPCRLPQGSCLLDLLAGVSLAVVRPCLVHCWAAGVLPHGRFKQAAGSAFFGGASDGTAMARELCLDRAFALAQSGNPLGLRARALLCLHLLRGGDVPAPPGFANPNFGRPLECSISLDGLSGGFVWLRPEGDLPRLVFEVKDDTGDFSAVVELKAPADWRDFEFTPLEAAIMGEEVGGIAVIYMLSPRASEVAAPEDAMFGTGPAFAFKGVGANDTLLLPAVVLAASSADLVEILVQHGAKVDPKWFVNCPSPVEIVFLNHTIEEAMYTKRLLRAAARLRRLGFPASNLLLQALVRASHEEHRLDMVFSPSEQALPEQDVSATLAHERDTAELIVQFMADSKLAPNARELERILLHPYIAGSAIARLLPRVRFEPAALCIDPAVFARARALDPNRWAAIAPIVVGPAFPMLRRAANRIYIELLRKYYAPEGPGFHKAREHFARACAISEPESKRRRTSAPQDGSP